MPASVRVWRPGSSAPAGGKAMDDAERLGPLASRRVAQLAKVSGCPPAHHAPGAG